MESRLQNQERTLQTNSNVLQTLQLPRNLPRLHGRRL
jgi:hypothetical protein